jgi:hypothetical protein
MNGKGLAPHGSELFERWGQVKRRRRALPGEPGAQFLWIGGHFAEGNLPAGFQIEHALDELFAGDQSSRSGGIGAEKEADTEQEDDRCSESQPCGGLGKAPPP